MSFLGLRRSKTVESTTSQGEEGNPLAMSQADMDKITSLNGHPGMLTKQQESALETFRGLVTDAKLYTPASGETKASHTDATLLRFLRARKFDPPKAFKQFSEQEAWRKQYNVEELYRTFPVDEMEGAKKYYPTWSGRRDKRGLPVYVYRLADLDSKVQKELNAVSMDRRYERIVALYEYMFNGVLNLCGALSASAYASSTPPPPSLRRPDQISSVCTLIDLSHVSLSQLWGARAHLQQASALATANYPETLDSILVLHAPSFFPTVWGWIQGWFDPGTRAKIKILGNPLKDDKTREVLRQFVKDEDLPRLYGGELEWTPGEKPNLDGPARRYLMDVFGRAEWRGPVYADPTRISTTSGAAGAGAEGGASKEMTEVDSGIGIEPEAVPTPAAETVSA